ncbi:hypothetical protein CFAM422_009119 [Trichoderma lentiforme]|uniref:Secreted protein n=1 Tax=Trichoderma lentiforme TaxID=1567552 RepID=A0A9P5CC10_9HYPO|nr:hypothetical protein CFAM422_009119 [Trichoderma lentiforme]
MDCLLLLFFFSYFLVVLVLFVSSAVCQSTSVDSCGLFVRISIRSFVRYATAKGGKTKSGFRPSPLIFTFFLLVGLAATELRIGRLWAASGSCRIKHFHHSSRCAKTS